MCLSYTKNVFGLRSNKYCMRQQLFTLLVFVVLGLLIPTADERFASCIMLSAFLLTESALNSGLYHLQLCSVKAQGLKEACFFFITFQIVAKWIAFFDSSVIIVLFFLFI